MAAHGRIDPLDPQSAEIALAVMTVAGGILIGFVNCLRRHLKGVFSAAIIAFGLLDDFLVAGVGNCAPFNA